MAAADQQRVWAAAAASPAQSSSTGGAGSEANQPKPASEPLEISLSEGGTWDIRQERLVADGQVHVRYQDWTLQADHVEAVLTRGQERLEARGHVVYSRPGQTVKADSLAIDLTNRQGQLEQAVASLELPSNKGILYVAAPSIHANKDRYEVDLASLTTCDLASPHYHLDAQRVTVYLGDRVVVEGVTFHDFGLPLFYWPRLTIPLRQQSTLELPQFGYSRSQGWFVKTAYSYYPTGWQAHGRIHLDYYSLVGWGTGIDHYYRDNPTGKGLLSLYVQPNRLTGHVDTTIAWQDQYQPQPGLTLQGEGQYATKAADDPGLTSTDVSLGTEGRQANEWSARLGVDYQKEPLQLQASWLASGEGVQDLAGVWRSTHSKQTFSWSGRTSLGPQIALSVSGERREVDTTTRTRYSLQVSQPLPWFRWAAGLEQELNPDLDKKGQPITWSAFSRSPYVALTGRPIRLPARFTAQWTAEVARLREAQWNGDMEGVRGLASLQLSSPTWTLRPGLSAGVSGEAQAAAYSGGERQVTVSSTASLTQRWNNGFSVGLRHEDRTVWGQSPFYFDEQFPSEILTLTARYDRAPYAASVSGGYDLYWRQWRNILSEVAWNPGPKAGVTAGLVLRPSGQLVAAALTGQWMPDDRHQVQLGAAYNVPAHAFDQLSGTLRLPLAGPFSVEAMVAYDGTTQVLSQAQAALIWDLHCRTVTFRYDQVQKTFWVQYQINAFPEARVGAGAGQAGVMLDVEGLRNFLDKWSSGNAAGS